MHSPETPAPPAPQQEPDPPRFGSASAAPVPVEIEALLERHVPFAAELEPADRRRLAEIAMTLTRRNLPPAFIASSLRSTAEVLRELREEERARDELFQQEHVRRFIEQNAVREPSGGYSVRRERRREERERLQANTQRLLREARLARGRHEIKKTRNMLLKVDQRELRRLLGREGEELCRQINTWLRSTASMF